MSDSTGLVLAVLVSEIIPATIAFYGAYWAFSIRRALAGAIYRSHALWLGVVLILLALLNFATYSNNQVLSFFISTLPFFIFPITFAFIDSTVRVARRSDPLARSIMSWERLRRYVWADIAILGFFWLVLSNTMAWFAGSAIGNIIWTALAVIPFAAGAPALLIGARRTGDFVLKGSMKWIGVALLLVIASLLESTIVNGLPGISQYDLYYSYYAVPGGAITCVSTYAFYRSARSLAPMNRIQSFADAMSSASAPAAV